MDCEFSFELNVVWHKTKKTTIGEYKRYTYLAQTFIYSLLNLFISEISNKISYLTMNSISNEYLIDHIITANEKYETIDVCFSVSQLNHDATKSTMKKGYRKFLSFHPDKNISPHASKQLTSLNQ